MTIIAGFSSSRHGTAPLTLAARIAKCTGEDVVAAAVVERAWPRSVDPGDGEYLAYISTAAKWSLENTVKRLPDDVDVSVVVHDSTSIPAGLMELAERYQASLVTVGSSSSGLLGRVTLGSVTDRLVHTAQVPVAIAPRGYPVQSGPIRRITAAYGGRAEENGLIAACAALHERWSVPLRIASFTVRSPLRFSASGEPGADELVVQRWADRTLDTILQQLEQVRDALPVPLVDIVIGSGDDWRDAVEDIPWADGDLLVLGSGSAGRTTQVFLGSAAAKIMRHSPVPVVIVPRTEPSG